MPPFSPIIMVPSSLPAITDEARMDMMIVKMMAKIFKFIFTDVLCKIREWKKERESEVSLLMLLIQRLTFECPV